MISACHSEIEWELWGAVSLAPAGGAGGVADGCTQCVWVPALFAVAVGIVAGLWCGWGEPALALGHLLCAWNKVGWGVVGRLECRLGELTYLRPVYSVRLNIVRWTAKWT